MPLLFAVDGASSEVVKIALAALFGWLVKYYTDRQAHAAQFDHRLRLEKEYALYAEIWEKLFELRAGLMRFSNDSDKQDRILFSEGWHSFRDAVDKAGPFMTTTIRDKNADIIQMCERVSFVGSRLMRNKQRETEAAQKGPAAIKLNDDEYEELQQEDADLRDAIVKEINSMEAVMRERVGPPPPRAPLLTWGARRRLPWRRSDE